MNTLRFLFLALLLSTSMLVGCNTVQISPMVKCTEGLSKEDLEKSCNVPTPLKGDALYEQGLRLSMEEKVELYRCGKKVQLLQDALKNCDKKVDEFNLKLKEVTSPK